MAGYFVGRYLSEREINRILYEEIFKFGSASTVVLSDGSGRTAHCYYGLESTSMICDVYCDGQKIVSFTDPSDGFAAKIHRALFD